MEKSTSPTSSAWWSEASEHDENEITQPLRIISSHTPHPGIPRKPRGSWFKEPEEPVGSRTPDFIEIGDPPA